RVIRSACRGPTKVPTMYRPDDDLLFGILALQSGFIDQPALIAAFHLWTQDKARPLAQILQDRGDLAPPRRTLLQALVEEPVAQHGGRAVQSLAALSSTREVEAALRSIGDEALSASLAHIAKSPRGYDDPLAIPESGPPPADARAVTFEATPSSGRF